MSTATSSDRKARPGGRRTRSLVVGLAVVAVGVGLVVARPGTATPDQPGPGEPEIFVQVERGELASRLVTRGTVATAARREILAPVPDDGHDPVVTGLPKAGHTMEAGTAPVEVAGRPIILLRGDLPPFRDLVAGDRGDDVARLQESLQQLGLMASRRTAVFDAGTQRALRALYARVGYPVPGGLDEPFFARKEFAVTPVARLTVAEVPVRLGDLVTPGQPLVVAATGSPVLQVDPGQPSLDEYLGWAATIDVADTTVTGVVSRIEQPDPVSVDGDRDPRPHLVVKAKGLGKAGLGSNLKVVLTDQILEDALLVPMSALQVDASGGHVVQIKGDGGSTAVITVRLEGDADGVAAIRPERPDTLREGDLVRVFAS